MDGYVEQEKNIYQVPGRHEGTSNAEVLAEAKNTGKSEEMETMQTLLDIPYRMRKLRAADIPLFAKIIGKIGIDELMACYGDDDFTDLLVKLKNRRQILGEGSEDEKTGNDQFILGAAVATRIANKIMLNIDSCVEEVFRLIGSLAGITAEDVANLDLETFMKMIVKVIMENNIGNFIRAARGLLQ